LKIVVETSAAVALAPILTGGIEARGLRIGIILSGGNVDLSELWYYRYPKSLKTGDEYG
jgi:threonine dehydratase